MNILVHTWWFSKYKGSEFAVAYNLCTELSKRHHLYVLVESCSYGWNDLSEFDSGGGYQELDNVDFITVPYANCFLEHFCKGVLSYFLFKAWERGVYRYIKKSGLMEKIDLIHYAAPVGYREPGFLHKFGKPYVWGPFGGMYRIPQEFLDAYPAKARGLGKIKNILNFLQFHSRRIKKVFRRSEVLIACTKTQQRMVNCLLNMDSCRYLPENGIDYEKQQHIDDECINQKCNAKMVNIIWIGRNDTNKNARLLVSALQKCRAKNFSCTFVGEGCSGLKPFFEKDCELLSRIKCIEKIPREKVLELYKDAHLMAITSSMEANTTVLFEAMENCVPIITVDHCGMADVVKDGVTGIKVKVQAFEKMADDFARKIDEVCSCPETLLGFAKNIKLNSYEYSQEYRMDFFDKCYSEAIQKYKERKRK